jgi:hypothetical protein
MRRDCQRLLDIIDALNWVQRQWKDERKISLLGLRPPEKVLIVVLYKLSCATGQ